MRLFGNAIARIKALFPVPIRATSSWLSIVRESFAGAWQRNVVVEPVENLLAFSAVFACVSLISDDISKLRIKLLRYNDTIWKETDGQSPFLQVLRKPNRYQTRIQFMSYWLTNKLLYGNNYVIKRRDARGVVIELYILDPKLVTVLVTDEGDVYYQLGRDALSRLDAESVTIPASEIIHDRMLTLWHPLVGVSPISACGNSASQGRKIQSNSSKFFENMSRPSGQLTAPGQISDAVAKRLKEEFEKNFSGDNIGRLLVTGDGLKYEPMPTIPANDAQLIEQLRWTVEDVARCFKVPLYKLGVGQPTLNTVGALNQEYYSQTLQQHIESIELLLDEGLSLPSDLGTELDLEGLLRMDPLSRSDRNERSIRAGYLAPNEARESENLPPVAGGNTPYLQQQNFSLAALAKRDALADPFAPATSPTSMPTDMPEEMPEEMPDDAEDAEEAAAEKFMAALLTKFEEADLYA